jgi:integrase
MNNLPAIGKNGPRQEETVMARNRTQNGWVRCRGGRWSIHYRIRAGDGWIQKSEAAPSAKGQDDAEKILRRRIKEVNNSNKADGPTSGLGDLRGFVKGPLWRQYLENKEMRDSTIYTYDSMLNRIVLPALGDKALAIITAEDVSSLLGRLRSEKKSKKYILNVYALLKCIFEVAHENDLIDKTPVRLKLHRPKVRESEKSEKPTLSADQVRRVEAGFPSEMRALCACVALTGLRLGELLGLQWGDVDLEASVLTVSRRVWRGRINEPKTEATKRRIGMSRQLTERLREHWAASKWPRADDFIFAQEDGRPMDPDHLRRQVLYPALEAAGIARLPRTHGFHLFRHTFGSIYHAETGDLKLTQKAMGHARISTTADIYVHPDDEVIGDGFEAVADTIWPGPIEVEGSETIQ